MVKKLKWNLVLMSALYLGLGVFLLMKPTTALNIVCYALGAVVLEADPTARGVLDVDTDGRCYLTAWDDRAAALWRIPVPGWVRPAQGGGLSARYQEALTRLCEMLRI